MRQDLALVHTLNTLERKNALAPSMEPGSIQSRFKVIKGGTVLVN